MDMKPFAFQSSYDVIGTMPMWETFNHMYNAKVFGYDNCLMPMPGTEVDTNKARECVQKVDREWELEWSKRTEKMFQSPGPKFRDMGNNAKCYMFNLVTEARKYFKERGESASNDEQNFAGYGSYPWCG